MKILSLFDGISCARVALERAGIPVEAYYASEIDKYAMQVSAKNWPEIVQVGGVVGLDTKQFKDIDLLIGGSPCQDLSIAKKDRKGLDGDRSGLFWEYVRILNEVKPKYFVLENVASMPKEAKALITETLGVEPIMIDAALVSAQRRKRLFWVGKRVGDKYETVPVELPEDRGIFLRDILEDIPEPPEGLEIKEKSKTIRLGGHGSKVGDKHEWDSVYQYRRTYWRETKGGKVPYVARATVQKNAEQYEDGKSPTLTTAMGAGGGNVPLLMTPKDAEEMKGKYIDGEMRQGIRKLSPIECERLQSLPDRYSEGVSNTQRYKALGNAFNVEVVAHILTSVLCK